jgi:Transketolase, thiamine diphosphate binding domain
VVLLGAVHPKTAKRGRRMARQRDIDQLAINTIRMLAVDAVQKANSGHPGTPVDAAPTTYVLWQRFLRYDPADPHWSTAIALSFRAATRRCCSTASYI